MTNFFDFDQRQKDLHEAFVPPQILPELRRAELKVRLSTAGLIVCASIVAVILAKKTLDSKDVDPQ